MDALPPELLWRIFMINTERGRESLDKSSGIHVDLDDRLDTARRCSQVCQLWRTLLLESSSIWGRLLHLQNLERATDAWREVVASRIGEASLWITGKVTDSTRPFIFAILQEKWQNVQELQIRDENLFNDENLPTWSFLEREAPKLEVFQLSADMYDDFRPYPGRILPFSPLFRNTAPLLKIFKLWVPFHFAPLIPWVVNLHSVTFTRPHNGPLILSALKSMPLLRELCVSGNTSQRMFRTEDSDLILDKPQLPLLESLIFNNFYHSIDLILFLESITLPPRHRSLRTLRIPEVNKTFLDHPRADRAVTKWIHAYMSASPPRQLSVSYFDEVLTLRNIEIDAGKSMKVVIVHDNQSYVKIESEIIATLRYSVEELEVDIASRFAWSLRPLFEALQTVTHLIADGYDLELLFRDMIRFPLFPNLHTIDLTGPCHRRGWVPGGPATIIPIVTDFLEHRVLIGSPLSGLDLSSFDETALPDWNKEPLEKIPGLSVILPKGTGDPW